jgi:hypothetical protein
MTMVGQDQMSKDYVDVFDVENSVGMRELRSNHVLLNDSVAKLVFTGFLKIL